MCTTVVTRQAPAKDKLYHGFNEGYGVTIECCFVKFAVF
jgi:hypothetical protein